MRRPIAPVLAMALLLGASAHAAAGSAGPQTTVPPPTPVPPDGSPSPYPSVLDTPRPSATPPELSAAAAGLFDLGTGQLLVGDRPGGRRPIASVTKVMTALLVLERSAPGEVVTVSATAAGQTGATLGLREGEEISVRDLLYALMLQSANDAAVALSEHVAGSVERFVDLMNDRAEELRLRRTEFHSPNGLDDRGYSTVRDLARIAVEAYHHPTFAEVAATRFHRIPAPEGAPRRIQNRNALLWLYPGSIGTKTGYTAAAGFCLLAAAERDGLRLGAVVLGAPREAFSDAAALLDHGFRTYELRAAVTEGEPFDAVTIDGRPVPVEAAATVQAVLRRDAEVDVSVEPDPRVSLPVRAGERVASVVVRADGKRVGRAPLVAMESVVVEQDDQAAAPWWKRVLGGIARFFDRLVRSLFG